MLLAARSFAKRSEHGGLIEVTRVTDVWENVIVLAFNEEVIWIHTYTQPDQPRCREGGAP